VTLTGDAAHACRPTDGQGGNQAFEDAVVLCRTLKDDLPIQQTLRKFEETRLPRVKRIHDDQRYENRTEWLPVHPEAMRFIDEGCKEPTKPTCNSQLLYSNSIICLNNTLSRDFMLCLHVSHIKQVSCSTERTNFKNLIGSTLDDEPPSKCVTALPHENAVGLGRSG
jgi:hypothetical protein